MKLRELLNTCDSSLTNIQIKEYIGEFGSCAADPEEDYRLVYDGNHDMRKIPDIYLDRAVDLWAMSYGDMIVLVQERG